MLCWFCNISTLSVNMRQKTNEDQFWIYKIYWNTSFPEAQKMLKCVNNSSPLAGCTWHIIPSGTGLVWKNSCVRPRTLSWDPECRSQDINVLYHFTGYVTVEVSFWNLRAVTSNIYRLPWFRLKGLKLSKDDEVPGYIAIFMVTIETDVEEEKTL